MMKNREKTANKNNESTIDFPGKRGGKKNKINMFSSGIINLNLGNTFP